MKAKNISYHLFLIFLVLITVLVGCATTQSVPYATTGLRQVKSLPEQKVDKQLTIRMNEELLNLVVSIKPVNIPVTMAYNFFIGESVKTNIVNTFIPLFRSVNVSTEPINELTKRGLVLEVALRSYSFDLAASVFSPHLVKLILEYKGYDEDGKNIFTIMTETSGSSNEYLDSKIGKTLDDWGRFPINPPSAAPYVGDMSNAYDVALSRSIEKLFLKVNEVWVHAYGGAIK